MATDRSSAQNTKGRTTSFGMATSYEVAIHGDLYSAKTVYKVLRDLSGEMPKLTPLSLETQNSG
jgi:hypothetical protein